MDRRLLGEMRRLAESYPRYGSLWENGYVESFNGKLRDELLNGEWFLSLPEARYVLDEWRLDYNHHRPHSSLEGKTPAAFAATLEDTAAGVVPAASRAGLRPSFRFSTRPNTT